MSRSGASQFQDNPKSSTNGIADLGPAQGDVCSAACANRLIAFAPIPAPSGEDRRHSFPIRDRPVNGVAVHRRGKHCIGRAGDSKGTGPNLARGSAFGGATKDKPEPLNTRRLWYSYGSQVGRSRFLHVVEELLIHNLPIRDFVHRYFFHFEASALRLERDVQLEHHREMRARDKRSLNLG